MKVIIEKRTSAEGGGYVAYTNRCRPVVYGSGESVAEAKSAFNETLKDVIEDYRSTGDKVPKALLTRPEFRLSVKSIFEAFPWLNASAVARSLGINSGLMRQYKRGTAYASEERLAEIESGLRSLAAQLAELRI